MVEGWMFGLRRVVLACLVVAVAGLAACGGGETGQKHALRWGDVAAASLQAPAEFERKKRLGIPLTPADQTTQSAHADALFDWAEQNFKSYFPSRSATLKEGPWLYRSYFATGILLGVNGEEVFIQGGPFGTTPVRLGRMDDYVARPNRAPVIDWTAPGQAVVGSPVVLDATKSADPDRDPVTFQWTLSQRPQGSSAAIESSRDGLTRFTPDVAGTYVVTLTVSDQRLTTSSAPTSIVVVAANAAPTAVLRAPQSGTTGQLVSLDGGESFDPNGDRLSFVWTLVSRPSGSQAVLSSLSQASTNSFTPDVEGVYEIRLVASDGRASSAPVSAVVTVQRRNAAPNANAGANQSVNVGATVTLDGSLSSDPDRDPLTYSWVLTSKPLGSVATLAGASSARPTFVADVAGTYVVSLVTSDGRLTSSTATVTIVASAPQPTGLERLIGRLTLVYSFTGSSTVFTDVVTFRRSNISGDTVTSFNQISLPISCGPTTVTGYSFLCMSLYTSGSRDIWLFNINNGRVLGVYEWCPARDTLSTCSSNLLFGPDGTVTGTMEPGSFSRPEPLSFSGVQLDEQEGVRSALKALSAHSAAQPAVPESVEWRQLMQAADAVDARLQAEMALRKTVQ